MTLYLFKNGNITTITISVNGFPAVIKTLLIEYDKIEVYDEGCGEYLFTCRKETKVNPNITTYTYRDYDTFTISPIFLHFD